MQKDIHAQHLTKCVNKIAFSLQKIDQTYKQTLNIQDVIFLLSDRSLFPPKRLFSPGNDAEVFLEHHIELVLTTWASVVFTSENEGVTKSYTHILANAADDRKHINRLKKLLSAQEKNQGN